MTTTTPAQGTESRRPTFSVRTRITVAVALLVAVALTGAGALVYVLTHAGIEDRVVQLVDQEMREFAEFPHDGRLSSSDLITGYLESNVGTSSELLVGYWAEETQLYSFASDARLRYARGASFAAVADDLAVTGRSTWLQTDLGEVYVDVQRLSDGGAFLVLYFLADEYETLYRTMRSYAVAAALALLLVTFVAALQAGRLLRPVRTLRKAAEDIGARGDLHRRIPVSGNDDITDLTRTVNAMLSRLEDAFSTQRAFLDDAGHELRTPLTILRGHLELLDERDPDEVGRTRALVLDEVDRMSRLVQDLLTLAKAERPDFLDHARVDVADLVDDVAEKCRGLADRTWVVDAQVEVEADLDRQRVTQALLQFAQNAVAHTAGGDTIGLGSALRGDRVVLWVRDTGPGVASEHKDVIFQRFGRGRVPADDDGFGLGLSIVAAIVAGHGGTVAVHDEEPHGARFEIELPLRRGAAWPAS